MTKGWGWSGVIVRVCVFASCLVACSTTHTEMDSNTNWLRECRAGADCGKDQVCACGVCTVACLSSDACSRPGGPAARCVEASKAQCGGDEDVTGAVCAAQCQRD